MSKVATKLIGAVPTRAECTPRLRTYEGLCERNEPFSSMQPSMHVREIPGMYPRCNSNIHMIAT